MRTSATVLAICLAGMMAPAMGQEQAGWVEQKCRAYEAAWAQALETHGSEQMNYAFIAGNENFIAGGCTTPADICPRSNQEIEIANALTLALMNAGTASTFLPFKCPAPPPGAGAWQGPGL